MPKFKLIKEIYNNLIFPDGTPPLFIAAAVLIGILISPLLVVAGIGFGIYTLVNFIKNGGKVSDDESNSDKAFEKLENDTNQVTKAYAKLHPALRYLPGSNIIPSPDKLELGARQSITAAKLTDNLSHDDQVKAASKQLAKNAYAYFSKELKEYREALSTIGKVAFSGVKQAVSSDSLKANEHLNAAQGFFANKQFPIDKKLQDMMDDIDTENYIEKIDLLKKGIQGGTGLADEYWNTFYGGWKLVEENGEQRLHLGGDYVGPENKGLFQHMQELEYLASEDKKREESEELTGEDLLNKKKNDELERKIFLKYICFNVKQQLKGLIQKASEQVEIVERENFDPGDEIPFLNYRIRGKKELIAKMRLEVSQETSKGPENRNSKLVEQLTTRIQFQNDEIDRMQNEIDSLRNLDKLGSSLGIDPKEEVDALSSTIKELKEQKKVMNVDLKKQKDALNKNYGRGWKSKITEEEKKTLE
ncbi:MAG: hypothetical protein VXW87_04540, partial [Pseudomonadota bacterium]|nr:hypothetical protein [Pseudomonadota bacterium]